MPVLRLPKTTRWIIICAAILLVLMLLYRVTIYLLFAELFRAATPNVTAAFLLGVLFDLRIIAIITFVIFGLSYWPGIHYFKTKAGKLVAIWMYGTALAVLNIFYMADIVHLRCFQVRLNGSIVFELVKHTPKGIVFLNKIEWLPMLASLALFTGVFVYIIKLVHKFVAKKRGTEHTSFRIAWQAGVIVFCLLFIYGGFRTKPLTIANLSPRYNAAAVQLAVTPLESIVSTLPQRHKK